jgi:hypothetical protein
MASEGNVDAMLTAIQDPATQLTLKGIFRYVLSNIAFGRATAGGGGVSQVSSAAPAENFPGGFFKGTTAAVANREFTVAHNFGRSPYLLIPVLPLDQIGAQLVPLTVTRAADASYVYLKSGVVSAPIFVYVEG